MKLPRSLSALLIVLVLGLAGCLGKLPTAAQRECANCQGEGEIKCLGCGGKGRTTPFSFDGSGSDHSDVCGSCHGTGHFDCGFCGGDGQI
jgi:hypothetical protein